MSATEFSKSAMNGAYASNVKAYYRFESGALTTDSSGNGVTLTNNNTVAEGASGKFGGCADFSSSNSNKYLSASNNLGIDGGVICMSCWVNLQASPGNNTGYTLMSQSNATSKVAYYMTYYNNAGTPGLYFNRSKKGVADQQTSYAVTLSTGTWYHLVMTYDATNVKAYLNGALVAVVAASGNGSAATPDRITIGSSTTPDGYSSAFIDDAVFMNWILTAEQIRQLYEGRILGELWPQSGLVALYHGSDVNDYSGNGYTLTNANSVGFVPGKFGNCADFGTSNINKRLYISNNLGIDGGSMTFMFWIKLRTEIPSGYYTFVTLRSTTSKTFYEIYYDYNSGTRRLAFDRGKPGVADQQVLVTKTLGTTDWYHLALTYDLTNVNAYINGNLVGQQAASGNGSAAVTTGLSIGTDTAGANPSSMYIDEIPVFNKALSPQEIRRIYARGVGKLD